MRITRRKFIEKSAAAFAALRGAPFVLARAEQRPDVVIRGGTIFDGTGARGIDGDVVVREGRLLQVGGRAALAGTVEIDARGLAVAPGFIDIHSHGDGSLESDPRAESVVRQGITTIVVGQDGSSSVPSRSEPTTAFGTRLARFESMRSTVNVASMVGLGSIRALVIGGEARSATASEIGLMRAMVEDALAGGACGASSGLEYTPGAFATAEELAAVCRPLATRGLPYATHMRNEDDRLLDSIDESIAVARGAGCPLQISHLKTQGPRNWNKLDSVFERVAAARQSGLDITFDRYPYTAYSTSLGNLFPIWSREGGVAALVRRMSDQGTAERVRGEALAKVAMIGGWDNVLVTGGVSDPELRAVVGRRLGAFAASIGQDPYDVTRRLLAQGSPGMVGFAMSEENLDRILAHPNAMVCSDGGAYSVDSPRGSPHPRGLGSFPRVLGRYVRERRALTLEDAIRKMTSAPATRLKLTGRGRLVVGMAADITVFDPATIADRATYEAPFQYPVGIRAVVVNGIVALHDGERNAQGSGRGLKPAR